MWIIARETHENIEGVWTFDRIPERHRPLFTGVLASITTSEQPHDTDTQRSAEPLPQELLKAA